MSKEASVPTGPPTNSSIAKKLIQAGALAAMLVPLGSVGVEAAPITCGFGGASGGAGCEIVGEGGERLFEWGAYSFQLAFQGLTGNLIVTINDLPMDQETFDGREGVPVISYDCVTLVAGEAGCREFDISTEGEGVWLSYTTKIQWDLDTNGIYPNGPDPLGPVPGQIRVLQNSGLVDGEDFTIDMCLTFPSPGCEYFPAPVPGDPAIRSGDTAFSSMIVSRALEPDPAAVPEPASLVLLGTGLVAAAYGRRRRR